MMANSKSETLKPSQNPPFTFTPHRRRPLQSNTFRTFVLIMSHCNSLQSTRQHTKLGEAGEENKLVGVDRLGEVAERNEMLDHDPMEIERLLVEQKSSANVTKEAIDGQVEDATGKTVEGDLLDHMDITTDDKNGDHVDSFMEDNQTIDGVFYPISGQKDGCNVADATEVTLTRQEEVDKQALLNEVPEAADSSLEMDMVAEFSRPIQHGDEKNSTEENTLPEGIEHELQLKEMELEKLIYASSAVNSPICDDVEEGEILGDVVHDDTMDFLFNEAVSVEEKKAEEAQIHRDIIDIEEITCDGVESDLGTYGRSSSACLNVVDSGKDSILETESIRRDPDAYAETLAGRGNTEIKKVDEHGIVLETGLIKDQASEVRGTDPQAASANGLASRRQVNSEGTTENKASVTNEKDKSVEKKKKKRGPLSKEQKEKKKKKERIKRAEKNRKLGVKRLKLQPVLKPKTVTYCRHYLKGRCQEGEKCKFSHDTIPLTKSQPCCHFARHSCMKGDCCPFDHQLSKYPCNNYVATGYCSRGADCLFSHTMAEKEGRLLTSNVPKPESKSSFQTSVPNSMKQAKIHGDPPLNSSGKSTEKKVAQLLQRPATQVPKGISVFSPLRSSPGDTSKHEQAAQHLKGDNGVKIGPKLTNSSADSRQKSNDIMKRAPMRTPKGINFLSFGKAPLPDSGSKENRVISESVLCELNQSTFFRSPPKNDGGGKTENPSEGSLLEPDSNKNKAEKLISPASRPQGIKFLSFAEVPGHNSSASGQAGLLPRKESIGFPLVHKRENVLDGLKFSNEMPCGLASSSNLFCQSSHQSGPRNAVGMSSSQKKSLLSNTPSSVQKALQSTLAFAAKFDSKVKLDEPIGTPASSSGN